MRNHLLENTLTLLGGAGLGAAIMYLFDPDQGPSRREDLSSTASDALSSTGEAVHSTLHGARSSAKSLAGRISEYAHDLADHVGQHASEVSGRASSLASDAISSARRSAQSASKSARSYASEAADRAGIRKMIWLTVPVQSGRVPNRRAAWKNRTPMPPPEASPRARWAFSRWVRV